MRKKQTADQSDAIEFEKINSEIDALLRKLRNVCPCCLARGLIFRGAHLLVDVAGGAETVETCLDIVAAIECPDDDGGISEGHTKH